MSTFTYSFDEMIQWYKANLDNSHYFDNSKEVIAFVIEKNPVKEVKKFKNKRPHKQGPAQRYIINRVKDTVRKINLTADKDLYPLGLYTIMIGNSLYVTFPTVKTDKRKRAHTFGDHFSFCRDTNKEECRINLHVSLYMPTGLDVFIGYCDSPEHYFTDGIELPVQGHEFTCFHKIDPYDKMALDLARMYVSNGLSGGMRKGKKNKQTQGTRISTELQTVLAQQKVQKVFAVAFKTGTGWEFSVYIHRKSDEVTVSNDNNEKSDVDETMSEDVTDIKYWSYGFSSRNAGIQTFQNRLLAALRNV